MILTYEAIDAQGHKTSDTIDAESSGVAIDRLQKTGFYVTHIAQASEAEADRTVHARHTTDLRLPLKALVTFTRQMAMLLRAGSAVVPAVEAIRRQMKKPADAALLGRIVHDVEEGATLTEALRKHPATFDPVYSAIVAAGEASATLDAMFARLADEVMKRRALRNKTIGALAYPTLLIGMSGNILLSLMFFVIPRFNDMFVQLGADPPTSTKVLLSVSGFLSTYWPFVFAGAISGLVATVVALRSDAGRQWLSDLQVEVPLLGRIRSWLIQAQVFRTMGMLLANGVGILEALDLVRPTTRNRRFQKLFDDLETTVTSGGQLATAFEDAGLIEPHICQAIRTGDEAGSAADAMTYCADILDETNTELINTAMRLIEPLILIGMGMVVGLVAISLFLPLFDMTSAMR